MTDSAELTRGAVDVRSAGEQATGRGGPADLGPLAQLKRRLPVSTDVYNAVENAAVRCGDRAPQGAERRTWFTPQPDSDGWDAATGPIGSRRAPTRVF